MWMSTDGQCTKRHRNIAENYNRLSRVHERYRQTDDRQTDDRQTDRRRHIGNVNVSSRSLTKLWINTSLQWSYRNRVRKAKNTALIPTWPQRRTHQKYNAVPLKNICKLKKLMTTVCLSVDASIKFVRWKWCTEENLLCVLLLHCYFVKFIIILSSYLSIISSNKCSNFKEDKSKRL